MTDNKFIIESFDDYQTKGKKFISYKENYAIISLENLRYIYMSDSDTGQTIKTYDICFEHLGNVNSKNRWIFHDDELRNKVYRKIIDTLSLKIEI
jgi:hypothetical protein